MKVILDLDTGIDDALALAYALAHPDLELIGVTVTYGNVPVELGVRNTLVLLELLGAGDVPVFAGAQPAGFQVKPISAFIHGRNGIGDVLLPPPRGQVQQKSAVEFLCRAAREHGEDLVIIPTGPSTTIAAALKAEPALADTRIVMMGGALTVPGNVTTWSEANVAQDPAATDFLFRTARDVTMVGLDVTLQTLLTTAETRQWRGLGTRAGRVYADMLDYYIRAYAAIEPDLGGCGLHDPLAVAVAADPSLVTCFDTNLACETTGTTPGRTIGDVARMQELHKAAHVAVDVDAPRFVAELMDKLDSLLQQH
ncbi:nucleoside hydrolase [Corynebacterium sp. HMSC06D04]|uniref:Inosine-uridine preferring nucleoside hydrolase family protein n=1 Tax=Corynebacterium simulans TaxID=146827 RepID=A0ABR5V8K5_9CORY|nr:MULTISPECIES: nucleoside hydrolase [Corynebacterium]AMO92680.1 inosine-uridine preferring nucleoside hydrolase family protein [Corynebacterium simulans]KXU17908.1 inosine-uridine preferring nucleoside hydrolase family protein [Corynebacterium simulans]MCG7246502.1 nucleoside hydrolase [Corynebacterium simulans]OFT48171.1 nucleoside hydrolase [Corynebacterium sp. HMSC06G04]OFT49901.1 nucleoside hydrolase [Corynebacterium sp. HMSC06D04]